MVDCCLDAGIGFSDTANTHNYGWAETLLEGAPKGRRQHVVIASKVWDKMGNGLGDGGLARAPLLARCDAGWRRLRAVTPKYNL